MSLFYSLFFLLYTLQHPAYMLGADAGILARYVSSWTNYARYFN